MRDREDWYFTWGKIYDLRTGSKANRRKELPHTYIYTYVYIQDEKEKKM